MKHKILIFLLLIFTITGFAQRKKEPRTEDVSVAKKLKTSFEEEDIVLLSKKVTVTFQKNKKKGLVEAVTVVNSDYLNIGSSSRLQHPVFYDTESKVDIFLVKDRDSRSLKSYSFKIKDEYLKNEDLFHTNYRVKYVNLQFPLQGSRLKTVTEKTYNDIKYFTSEYFAEGYRIQKGTLQVVIPSWLDLELKEFHFEDAGITKKVTKNANGKKLPIPIII